MNAGRTHLRDALLILCLGTAVFLLGLGDRELLGFECRFGRFAQEMLQRGWSFFPTLYGKPYPDYPSTQTALIRLASMPAGKVTILAAVLPTALSASSTLVLTYLIGARRSRSLGLCAALLEAGTYGFLAPARSTSLDHMLTAATAYTYFAATRRPPQAGRLQTLLVALGLAGGFLLRGPIGLVIPAAVLLAHDGVERAWRRLAGHALLSLALLAAGLAALLLAARAEGGDELLRSVVRMQAAGRLVREDAAPFHYYVTAGLAAYAPCLPLAFLAIAIHGRSPWKSDAAPEVAQLRSLAGWVLVILLGMSIPMQKKMRYILPVLPAAALLAAQILEGERRHRAMRSVARAFTGLCLALPALALAAVTASPFARARLCVEVVPPILPALTCLVALTCGSALVVKRFGREARAHLPALALGVATLAVLQVGLVEPITLARDATRPFAAKVEPLVAAGRALVFYKMGPDQEDVKLMVNLPADVQPEFLDDPGALAACSRPACVIAESKDASGLRDALGPGLETGAAGKIGHRDCIVLLWH